MLRWGLMGTSFISDTMAAAIAASPGSRAIAAFGRDEDRLAAFADRHTIARRHQSLDALAADPEVDVVYVGLPNHCHAEAVEIAAHNGKPVLSEKSLATTAEDAERIAKAVTTSGVFFLEGLMYLCHPFAQALIGVIASGELGRLRAIHLAYAADIAGVANPAGMGTIFNLGCYPASLLEAVMRTAFGREAYEARRLAALANRSARHGIVEQTTLSIRFDNGVMAQIAASDCHGFHHLAVIEGEAGRLVVTSNPWLPAAGANHAVIETAGGDRREIVVNSGLDAFGHQVRVVEAALAAGRTSAPAPAADLDTSLAVFRLLDDWHQACPA